MKQRKIAWTSPGSISVIIISLAALVIILLKTYALQIFRFNVSANEPTVSSKNIVLSSILRKPSLFSFIVFRNTMQPDSAIWMYRVCGMPGDTVEIRNGDLLINNRQVDSMLTLSHSYIINSKDTAGMHLSVSDAVPILNTDSVMTDSIMITYPDQMIRQKGILYHRYILPETIPDSYIQKQFQQPWNIDHFGPVAVPAQSFFVLGDNRSNSMDSRYIGFVREKDFKGTVLNH